MNFQELLSLAFVSFVEFLPLVTYCAMKNLLCVADGGKRFTDGVDGDVDEDGSMLAWTVEEKEELLLNILTYLSSLRKDNLSYRRRLQRFEWEAVVTNSRSAGECQNQWTDMAKKVRNSFLIVPFQEFLMRCLGAQLPCDGGIGHRCVGDDKS